MRQLRNNPDMAGKLCHARVVGKATVDLRRTSMSLIPDLVASMCVLGFVPLAEQVYAAPNDPAAIQVERLHTALLTSMQAGSKVALTDRYRDLQPVVEQVFDLPLMTRLAIGPPWANFSQEQQQVSLAAFRRLTIASYAVNF